MEDYREEMKTAIKEIIEDFDYNIKKSFANIQYYEELIHVKQKHNKDAYTDENTLFALRHEKNALENAKTRIENIFYDNDIPEKYYKIKEEE